jgi:hypothetical protein
MSVKRAEFITDRTSDITLRCLNVHGPNEDKSDIMKDSFYEELDSVLDQFSKYNVKILLRKFFEKLGTDDIESFRSKY